MDSVEACLGTGAAAAAWLWVCLCMHACSVAAGPCRRAPGKQALPIVHPLGAGLQIRQRCGMRLYVSPNKLGVLSCLGLPEEEVADTFTTDPRATPIHVVGWGVLGETWPFFRPNFTSMERLGEEHKAQEVPGRGAGGPAVARRHMLFCAGSTLLRLGGGTAAGAARAAQSFGMMTIDRGFREACRVCGGNARGIKPAAGPSWRAVTGSRSLAVSLMPLFSCLFPAYPAPARVAGGWLLPHRLAVRDEACSVPHPQPGEGECAPGALQ
jgi:hypothetical protein